MTNNFKKNRLILAKTHFFSVPLQAISNITNTMKYYSFLLLSFLLLPSIVSCTPIVPPAEDSTLDKDSVYQEEPTLDEDSVSQENPYRPAAVGSYAYGADCSWITEEEADGVLFYDSVGNPQEGMRLMRDYGMLRTSVLWTSQVFPRTATISIVQSGTKQHIPFICCRIGTGSRATRCP